MKAVTAVVLGAAVWALLAHASPSAEVFAPGVISDDREQYRITFTPSGDTAYFAAGDGFFPMTREASIYFSVRVGGEWQPPELAPFSGHHPDIDPFITPDGRRLYFSSIRPRGNEPEPPIHGAPQDPVDIWMVERRGEGWSEPVRVPVGTPFDDLYPSVDREGNLYFATQMPRAEGDDTWNIWVARRTGEGFADPEPLTGHLNTSEHWEFNPAISSDGRRLVFTRLNPSDAVATGLGELHVSFLRDGTWSEARNLGPPVNTELDEYHPSFSPDGATLYFVRRDPFEDHPNGDLYRIPVAALEDRLRTPDTPAGEWEGGQRSPRGGDADRGG